MSVCDNCQTWMMTGYHSWSDARTTLGKKIKIVSLTLSIQLGWDELYGRMKAKQPRSATHLWEHN